MPGLHWPKRIGDPVAPGSDIQRRWIAGQLKGKDFVGGDDAGAAVGTDLDARVDPELRKPPTEHVRVPEAPIGSYYYRLKLHTYDNASLAAAYFPAKIETGTPVVLLVHEKDRSSKDFEDPIAELKNQGLAEHLQGAGYAVLSFDLRGYGANTRRAMSDREWKDMVYDLQAAYHFLLDRHNRGELNLSKLGVIALGDGANLAAAWAFQPGAAVTTCLLYTSDAADE